MNMIITNVENMELNTKILNINLDIIMLKTVYKYI